MEQIKTVNENVGEPFSVELLELARDKTLEVIEVAAAQMKPGMTEKQAKDLVKQVQLELGVEKFWHPPQIRFGENTVLPFNQKGVENPELKENDIFFFDLGLVVENHEGDVGRVYVVGDDPEMHRCKVEVEEIWNEVRDHWKEFKTNGPELYKFATESAEKRGWNLSVKKADGHRISDFPHAIHSKASIVDQPEPLGANRWILEIQITHPERAFGAFYEDILS